MGISVDSPEVFTTVAEAIAARLPRNQRVRRNLPGHGRVRIDRQLPFLTVYRLPPDREDRGGRDLVTTEAAYLVAPGDEALQQHVAGLVRAASEQMREHFGVFLILEVWTLPQEEDQSTFWAPRFKICAPRDATLSAVVEKLKMSLEAVKVAGQAAVVEVEFVEAVAPSRLPPLLPAESLDPGTYVVGLGVEPCFRDAEGNLFPLLLQQLRRQLAQSVRVAVAAFASAHGGKQGLHYQAYGPSSMVRAARRVDQTLSEFQETFDFLLQVTPVNSDAAWQEFKEGGCKKRPTFRYRPLPYDPNLLKRQLFEVPLERVEDPTLAHLFWEKQTELDRQVSALRDIDTPAFAQHTMQIYGGVEEELAQLARDVLAYPCEGSECDDDEEMGQLTSQEVAQSARDEIDYYHQRCPAFQASVQIREDISSGLMVSRGKLLVSPHLSLKTERLQPLLDHEVGTHLVTFVNGRQQPLRLLALGLAGYEALQEGLAVFAEYLAGGLTPGRLRTLAGRVLAVQSMLRGNDFLETYQLLREEFRFGARSAFVTSLRVHRGGGFTKDAVYLRGLQDLLAYLQGGHDIAPLYVGKIALEHILYIQELRRREIIRAPAVLPRFWADPALKQRLDESRNSSVLDLMKASIP